MRRLSVLLLLTIGWSSLALGQLKVSEEYVFDAKLGKVVRVVNDEPVRVVEKQVVIEREVPVVVERPVVDPAAVALAVTAIAHEAVHTNCHRYYRPRYYSSCRYYRRPPRVHYCSRRTPPPPPPCRHHRW